MPMAWKKFAMVMPMEAMRKCRLMVRRAVTPIRVMARVTSEVDSPDSKRLISWRGKNWKSRVPASSRQTTQSSAVRMA